MRLILPELSAELVLVPELPAHPASIASITRVSIIGASSIRTSCISARFGNNGRITEILFIVIILFT
jgi:hypothetical protein